MQKWNNTKSIWLLALLSIFGIIMMLVLDGIWDVLMLFVTILPLLVAGYRVYQINQSARKNGK